MEIKFHEDNVPYVEESISENKTKFNGDNSEIEPLISIVTVVYNGEKYLEETIKSIISQTYKNIEYIIIDGGSTDGTLDIIKRYKDHIDYWVSEKDNGIFDAMNKGILRASGSFIGFINSDDWYEKDAMESMFALTDISKNTDFIYSNFNIYDQDSKFIYTYKSSISGLSRKMTIGHPGLFIRRDVQKNNLFDLSFPMTADYDLLLRLVKQRCKPLYIDKAISNFRLTGITANTNVGFEVFRVQKKHFGVFKAILPLIKYEFQFLTYRIIEFLLGDEYFNKLINKLKYTYFQHLKKPK